MVDFGSSYLNCDESEIRNALVGYLRVEAISWHPSGDFKRRGLDKNDFGAVLSSCAGWHLYQAHRPLPTLPTEFSMIEPLECSISSLSVPVSLENEALLEFTVTNRSTQLIAIKIKTNNRDRYLVKPTVSLIDPNGSMRIQVKVPPFVTMPDPGSRDKLLVQAKVFDQDPSSSLVDFWKNLEKDHKPKEGLSKFQECVVRLTLTLPQQQVSSSPVQPSHQSQSELDTTNSLNITTFSSTRSESAEPASSVAPTSAPTAAASATPSISTTSPEVPPLPSLRPSQIPGRSSSISKPEEIPTTSPSLRPTPSTTSPAATSDSDFVMLRVQLDSKTKEFNEVSRALSESLSFAHCVEIAAPRTLCTQRISIGISSHRGLAASHADNRAQAS